MSHAPHVLLILHDFPPMAGGGVMRWLKLTRYLCREAASWTVIAAEPFHEQLDPALLDEIDSSVEVLRIRDRGLRRLKARWFSRGYTKKAPTPSDSSFAPSETTPPGRFRAVYLAARTNLNIPDDHLIWAIRAFLLGRRRVRGRHTVVITSGPPHSSHVAGLLLSLFTPARWIMDYRDGWAHNPLYKRTWRLSHLLDRALEQRCLERCDRIVVDTSHKKEELTEWYETEPRRIHVITNGYDPEDYSLVSQSRDPGHFILAYTGNLRERRTSRYLVDAIIKLKKSYPDFAAAFRFRLVGRASEAERPILQELGDSFIDEGYHSHRRAMEILSESDAAWLTEFAEGGGRSLAPGKTYAYIGARVFILATIHECSAADIVREGPYGVVVPPDDVEAIARALQAMFEKWKSGEGLSIPDDAGKYSRKQQARCYLDILTDLSAEKP